MIVSSLRCSDQPVCSIKIVKHGQILVLLKEHESTRSTYEMNIQRQIGIDLTVQSSHN